MQKSLRRLLLAAALLIVGAGTASAQPLQAQTTGGVTYVAGGIGEDDVKAMREQAAGYSALIEFVEVEPGSQRGNWTADIAVDVKSSKQLLASINVPGPMLLLRLAPGRYTLEATHGDVRLSKTLDIKPRGALLRERFIWRAAAGSLGNELRK